MDIPRYRVQTKTDDFAEDWVYKWDFHDLGFAETAMQIYQDGGYRSCIIDLVKDEVIRES